MRSFFGENILHRLVFLLKDDSAMWKFFLEYLMPTEINGLLFKKYQENSFCYQNWDQDVPDCIPKWLEKACNSDELLDVFCNKNAKGVTLLHAVARHCHEDFVQQVLDVMERRLMYETIRRILLLEDEDEYIPCQSAMENIYSESVFKVFWKFYKKFFYPDELGKLYFGYLRAKNGQYRDSPHDEYYIYKLFQKVSQKEMEKTKISCIR